MKCFIKFFGIHRKFNKTSYFFSVFVTFSNQHKFFHHQSTFCLMKISPVSDGYEYISFFCIIFFVFQRQPLRSIHQNVCALPVGLVSGYGTKAGYALSERRRDWSVIEEEEELCGEGRGRNGGAYQDDPMVTSRQTDYNGMVEASQGRAVGVVPPYPIADGESAI